MIKEKEQQEAKMQELIKQIITIKNDELFGYLSEEQVVTKFKELNEKLENVLEDYRDSLSYYMSIAYSESRESTEKEQTEMLKNYVSAIKSHIEQYMENREYTIRKRHHRDIRK